ncbi:MAG TPA: MraY family glycosyltransferase [Chitinophagaceae bacterium]|nr:MraY family glycosyltransferase [Chitinophagaceae bacterium]
MFDKPDERKTHSYSISSLGGVGIVAGLSLSLLLVIDFNSGDSEFQYYLACFFIIFILGLIDDIFNLKAWKKLSGQLLVAAILSAKAHLLLTSLHGLGGIFEINELTSYIITFFTVLLVINSFNLIDGVDGLSGSLGLVSSLAFGMFFYVNNMLPYAILGFAMAGSLLAFLMYNFPPAKIFMGDSGSMLIGLVNVILLLKFVNTDGSAPVYPISSSIAVGFGILIVPLLDVLRVFIIRLTKGVSPFAADRNHIHHLLLNRGFSHTGVTITLIISSVIFSALSFALQSLNINVIALILSALYFTGVFVVKYFAPKRKLHVVGSENFVQPAPDTKVLTLYQTTDNVALNEE